LFGPPSSAVKLVLDSALQELNFMTCYSDEKCPEFDSEQIPMNKILFLVPNHEMYQIPAKIMYRILLFRNSIS